MLKIVQFTNTYAPMVGGIEKSIARFKADFESRGHFVRVVTPAFATAERSEDGVLRLPAIKGVGEKKFSVRLPFPGRLDAWMEAVEPDLVHSHQPFMLGDSAWRVARDRNVPLVFTHHTLYERYAEWPLIERERAESLLLSLTTQYANRCDWCLAPTASVAELMRERGVRRPIEVLSTGIDVDRFGSGNGPDFRARHGIPPGAFVVGHLGRITAAKNMSFLGEAVAAFLERRPDAWFLLVGEGDELEPVRSLLANQGLEERLVTPGNLAGRAIADAYAAMNLFAFASHTDTQGLVLAEAMAAGVPVVALDAPGARDCLKKGEFGKLLPADASSSDFAASLESLADDRAARTGLADEARKHVREFDHKVSADRMEAFYQRVVAEHERSVADEGDGEWDQFVERMEREWQLLSEKFSAARKAVL